MNTSAGLLFVAIGLFVLWLAITGRLANVLNALSGSLKAPGNKP